VQQFARLGLLDELQLAVNPVILGSGKSALTDVDATAEPCEARSFTGGMVWLRYRLAADS
jgi:hypothetical protein